MEIRWYCYLIINCAVLIPSSASASADVNDKRSASASASTDVKKICISNNPDLAAKTFSLNKAIAEDSYQQKDLDLERQVETLSPSKIKDTTGERFSLNKALASVPAKSQRIKKSGINLNFFPLDKITSPLKYRKTFQIKSPLKPKKIKYVFPPWNKRKNKSIKRDVNGNEKFNRKYIPLLKSVGMLVDNLLNPDTSESLEVPKTIHKRNRDSSGERKRVVCTCAHNISQETKSNEETITSTTTFTSEISTATEIIALSETTAAPTNYSTSGNVSGIRQNKDVPILFPTNTLSGWRDYNGYSERSGAAHNWNTQRNISGNHGNGEYNTNGGQKSDAENYAENTNGYPRNDASSDGSHRRLRGDRNVTKYSNYGIPADKYSDEDSEGEDTTDSIRRRINEHKGENKFEVGGDQAKSTELVPEFIQRLRGLPQDKVHHISKSIQPKETDEKSSFSDTEYNTSNQRFSERYGTITTHDQNVRSRDEAVSPNVAIKRSKKSKKPVVFITDGYSVIRNKNGENKMSEKTIRLRS